jgi:hypothetical protein
MTVISPEVTVKGFQKCCMSDAVKRMGMLGVSVRKMKALQRWRQVTMICKGRQKPTCVVCKCLRVRVQYFLADVLLLGG